MNIYKNETELFHALPHIYEKWVRASRQPETLDVFAASPAWQLSAHTAFQKDASMLIAEKKGSILAFHIMYNDKGEVFLLPLESGWYASCPLLGEDAPRLLCDAISYILNRYNQLPRIFISGLPPNNSLIPKLQKLTGSYYQYFLFHEGKQRVSSLEKGYEDYLSRRSGNFRCKMKKAVRKAQEREITFHRIIPQTREESDLCYSRMLQIEERSWKGLGNCGMTSSPSKEFYAHMIRLMSLDHSCRIIFAQQEEKDIGFIFGGTACNIYRGQQFSYDNDWARYSIGDLLQLEKLKWLCEEGVDRYDMGMSDQEKMEYKSHWAEIVQISQLWGIIPH